MRNLNDTCKWGGSNQVKIQATYEYVSCEPTISHHLSMHKRKAQVKYLLPLYERIVKPDNFVIEFVSLKRVHDIFLFTYIYPTMNYLILRSCVWPFTSVSSGESPRFLPLYIYLDNYFILQLILLAFHFT